LPKKYYNILPDLPERLAPPLDPKTREPIKPEALEALFPKELVKQEVSSKRFIRIPEELRQQLIEIGRPRPLNRARRLEAFLKLPKEVKIYFKREDLGPVGSHKTNTALAQAYYAAKEGVEKYTTETGAGQWGSAVALATAFNSMKAEIYMVALSFKQKPYRKILMNAFGAEVFSSPSDRTAFGRKIREEQPDCTGSLGIAISEAIERAVSQENTKYTLGSVLNHVMLHQTIIGLETKKQFELLDEEPDEIIGCVGGGSNFAGIAYPFIRDRLKGKNDCRFVGVEPETVPSMTKGKFEYDFGDTAGMTPLLKMHTLGHDFRPPAIYAGGLRYHGLAPTLSALIDSKIVEPVAVAEKGTFEAGLLFARTEGIIPAPESSHAIRAAIDSALAAKKGGEKKTIVFNLSGHGLMDMPAYKNFL
jgi:tryptophan synthase beta chain